MKILFVASECVPFCKTGGLADVVGALPKALRKRRHDVRVLIPKYKTIRGQEFGIKETGEVVKVPVGDSLQSADLRVAKTEKGIKVYFLNHDGYYGRSGLYQDMWGEFGDNAQRFIFLARAALEACKALEFRPDIIHCHDWQTGLLPMYLKELFKRDAFFQHTATVFTIHNMAYQGVFPKAYLPATGFTWNEFTMQKFEFYDQISFMKAALVYSDALTTVSPTYAVEVQTAYEYGRGLEGLLRDRRSVLTGILNGLDEEEWDPSKDPFIAETFDIDSLERRQNCKAALQQSLRLAVSPDIPVLGMVSRLDPQKGVDLATAILPQLLMKTPVQFVVLGQGDAHLQRLLQQIQEKFPHAVRICNDFNEPLAHHIYAGADLFLMPSRFEPCGISQLIAMRYGTIPVVADTGGLHDTVEPFAEHRGTGFVFKAGDAEGFLSAIQSALSAFRDPTVWSALQKRAMSRNFSWDVSANSYLDVYRRALGRRTPSNRTISKKSH